LRSLVLLSGGLDSVVNLKCAADTGAAVGAITFDYGQAAAKNEIEAAAECARRVGVPHEVVELGDYWGMLPGPMRGSGRIAKHRDLDGVDARRMLREAWVPNRNGVFVNIGAAFAEFRGADAVVMGLNREEAEVFPDNSEDFLDLVNKALEVSTLSAVRVVSFTTRLSKREIVRLALENAAPLDAVYSCYEKSDDQVMCGECQSCVRLKRALDAERFEGLWKRFRR
jgi:7-cyano-7-deazaguanine synthase